MANAFRGANSTSGTSVLFGDWPVNAPAFSNITANPGDLIIVFAFNGANNTVPTVPAGYDTDLSYSGASNAGIACHKIAAGGETGVSGFTNAALIEARVCSGASGIGASAQNNGSNGTLAIPAVPLNVTDGTSWVVAGNFAVAATNMTAAPAGMGNEDDASSSSPPAFMGCDTDGGVSSFAGKTQSINGSGWISFALEILQATSAVTGTGAGAAGSAAGAGAGTLDETGTGSAPSGAPAASGSGTVGAADVSGTGEAQAPAAEGSGQGSLDEAGTGEGAPGDAVGAGIGTLDEAGTGQGSAPSPAAEGVGTLDESGSGSGAAPSPSASGSGTLDEQGSGSGIAPSPDGTGSGSLDESGSGSAAAPGPSGSGTGTLDESGTGQGTAPAPEGAGSGTVSAPTYTGTGEGIAPSPGGSGSGTLDESGAGSGAADSPEGSGSGTSLSAISGSGDGTAPAPEGDGAGFLEVTGTGSGAGPAPTASGSGTVFGALVTVTNRPGYSPAALTGGSVSKPSDAADKGWVRNVADVLNNVLRGRQNVVLTITLAANVDSSLILDARIGPFSGLFLQPLTTNAAAALAGAPYVLASGQKQGQVTLAHANNAQADRTFNLLIIG
ncbi:hypothetical protein [uncultured Devosia sp.]|uniref:beta strand repeat-containing protein n=1 Tax=uncultured Devosia sp. TaxID=211434 RepID=UPI002618ED3C|nr:hypothetical protein [uncultured Devosia sp.]